MDAIEQLKNYRHTEARIRALSTYSVGAGITVSRLSEEDQLQDLHRRLRGLPSYMYLSRREQELETTAHAYLKRYPAGVQSQRAAIPSVGHDDEDTAALRELRAKVAKVIAARGYDIRDDIDSVIDRLTELQALRDDLKRVEDVLSAMSYRGDWVKLLRLRYIEEMRPEDVAAQLRISDRTYWRRYEAAIAEYKRLAR